MKITFVSYIYPYPERGYNPGIERVVQEYAREIARQGHEIHVLTTYRNGGTRQHEKDQGVNIHRFPDARHYLGRAGSLFSLDFLSTNYFMREYSELLESSDVVHAFTPIVHWPFDIPLVSHFHHWDEPDGLVEYLFRPTSNALWMRSFHISDRVIAVSEYSADDLASRGIDRSKIKVVHNGVDTDRFHPGESEITIDEWETVLLYVGPLVERKGLEYLTRALPAICEEHPNTGLLIVGGGNSDPLSSLAKKLGVLNHIQFEGFVPEEDLPEYYRASDLFVFPSLLEGFGMVLLEAMATGLPVVSTTATAIPEVVGDAGTLVSPRDTAEITMAVSDILDNGIPEYHSDRVLRRVANHFTWNQTTECLLSIYHGIDD